jgi:hypothetical protein
MSELMGCNMEYKIPLECKFFCGKCKRENEFPLLSDGTVHNKAICCGITYVRTDKKGRKLR